METRERTSRQAPASKWGVAWCRCGTNGCPSPACPRCASEMDEVLGGVVRASPWPCCWSRAYRAAGGVIARAMRIIGAVVTPPKCFHAAPFPGGAPRFQYLRATVPAAAAGWRSKGCHNADDENHRGGCDTPLRDKAGVRRGGCSRDAPDPEARSRRDGRRARRFRPGGRNLGLKICDRS